MRKQLLCTEVSHAKKLISHRGKKQGCSDSREKSRPQIGKKRTESEVAAARQRSKAVMRDGSLTSPP